MGTGRKIYPERIRLSVIHRSNGRVSRVPHPSPGCNTDMDVFLVLFIPFALLYLSTGIFTPQDDGVSVVPLRHPGCHGPDLMCRKPQHVVGLG